MASARSTDLVSRGRSVWLWGQRSRPWRAYSHFTDIGGNVLAAGMSYFAVFAVFAGLWVGFGVVSIWLRARDDLLQSLFDQINMLVPGLIGVGSEQGVVSAEALLTVRTFDWTSLVAAVALLWVALAWFTGTRRAIRIAFGLEVKQYRNPVLLKLRDFVSALIFGVALVVSAALTLFSSNLTGVVLGWFGVAQGDSWLLGGLGVTARYGALYVFDVLLLLAIHWWLAEIRVPWRSLLAGCLLGGAALFGLKMLGTALLGGASSNPLLASFVVIVGLLIWFNLVCRTLLLTATWVATGQDGELGLQQSDFGAA